MDRKYRWNDIYKTQLTESDYDSILAENQAFYNAVKPAFAPPAQDIKSCGEKKAAQVGSKSKTSVVGDLWEAAAQAYEAESHAAFAKSFIYFLNPRQILWKKTIEDFICNQKKLKKPLPKKKNLKIMTEKHLIDKTRSFDPGQSDIVSATSVSGWFNNSIPGRASILQLGIYYYADADQINMLLRAAGYSGLYILDVYDIIFQIYADFYAHNYDLTPYEKLAEIKKAINRLLNAIAAPIIIDPKEAKLGSLNKLGLTIRRELDHFREYYGLPDNQPPNNNTWMMTNLCRKKYKNLQDLDLLLNNPDTCRRLFTQKYYGFLNKTLKYLEDSPHYVKNLYFYQLDFTKAGAGQINADASDSVYKRFNCQLSDTQLEDLEKNDTSKDACPDEKKLSKMSTALSKIWGINDLHKTNPNSHPGKKSRCMKADNLILGRKRNYTTEKSTSTYYVFELGSKNSLIHYAVATGHEDEIGMYLHLAGLWEKDWYTEFRTAILAGRTDQPLPYGLDRADWLILYALLYRDYLIDKWAEQSGRSREEYRRRVLQDFPFIQLLLTITRDISFCFMKCTKRIDNRQNQTDFKLGDIELNLQQMETDMIYPNLWIYYKKLRKSDSNQDIQNDQYQKWRTWKYS